MTIFDDIKETHLVSVIIPVYNAEETIEKSIQSIINQTYKNLEIIVVDDGSTDNTLSIIHNLASQDNRIIIIQNNVNSGCYFSRNEAIRISKGDYIAIQDADDISLPHRIKTQIDAIIKEDAKFTIARIYRTRCNSNEFNLDDVPAMMHLVESRRIKNESGNYEYRDRPILGFNSSVFHRSIFNEIGLFWEERFASDAEFCERILFQYADVYFKYNENIHTFLMNCDPIKRLYQRIDEVLVLSTNMGNDNITNRYSQDQKNDFEAIWRKRFNNEYNYEYPKLNFFDNPITISEDEISLKEKTYLKIIILEHLQKMKSEKILILEDLQKKKSNEILSLKELNERLSGQNKDNITRLDKQEVKLDHYMNNISVFKKELNWYKSTYSHLPKWFLKIGALFRRF